MLRAGIYNRCSTEEEAQLNALETQAEESRDIVIGRGWIIADQYIESESGTTSHKRGEYQRLLDDMETDKFDIVVIKSIDRLMRSAKEWYVFLDKLTQNRKQLYIYIDNKFYTPEDSLITGIKAILAEDFSRELSKKIKNAHKRRQQKKSGLNITSPMFGWDKVGKNEFVVNENEAASYRLAFALASEGKGFHSIAKIMYENGVRSKRGNRLDGTQWRNMIYSCRAHGTVVLHTTEYDFEARKRVKLPEEEWIYVEDALPPIVSREYQMEVLRELEERRKKRSVLCEQKERRGKTEIYYAGKRMSDTGTLKYIAAAKRYELSGKLICAECGKVYYRVSFSSGSSRLNEWKCSTMLHQGRKTADKPWGCNNINVLEDVILEKIEESCRQYYEMMIGQHSNIPDEQRKTGRDEKIAAAAIAMIRKVLQQDHPDRELAKLKKELEKLERKKAILVSKLVDEVINDGDFKAADQVISENMRKVRTKINDILKRTSEYNSYDGRLQKIKEALYSGVIDQAKSRELVRRISKIIVHPDSRIEILFDRVQMLDLIKRSSLVKRYEDNVRMYELVPEENECRICIRYEHKSNTTRRREWMQTQILKLFRENPDLMLKDVPGLVGMGESYVNLLVKELKEKGLLRYERNAHTGRWLVNDKV